MAADKVRKESMALRRLKGPQVKFHANVIGRDLPDHPRRHPVTTSQGCRLSQQRVYSHHPHLSTIILGFLPHFHERRDLAQVGNEELLPRLRARELRCAREASISTRRAAFQKFSNTTNGYENDRNEAILMLAIEELELVACYPGILGKRHGRWSIAHWSSVFEYAYLAT